MNEIDYNDLDPGIVDIVKLLRDNGIETTDSGDGVSKTEEEYHSGNALRFRHVFATTDKDNVISTPEFISQLMNDHGYENTIVESTYSTLDKECVILIMPDALEEIRREFHRK